MHVRLYELLGVDPMATIKDIKEAYRHRAKIDHPDRGGNRQKWDFLTGIYEVLSDPARRERYDMTGRTDISNVTPQRLKEFLKSMLVSMLKENHRPSWIGSIIDRMIGDIRQARPAIEVKVNQARRALEHAEEVKNSLVPTGLYIADDIIGSILQGEIDKHKDEIKLHEDMLELSREAEDVLRGYSVKAAPVPEGQYETRAATARRRLGQGEISMNDARKS
jgi:curved DNA-binding protein CbpA